MIKCQSKKRQQFGGVVILLVLNIVMILVIFATAAFTLSYNQQKNASAYYKNRTAEMAALSGVSYAMWRISHSPRWQGYDSTGSPAPPPPSGREDQTSVLPVALRLPSATSLSSRSKVG